MRRRIEPHVARALLRLHGPDDVIRVGRVLMDDGQRTVGVGRERIGRRRIVRGAVDALTDRQRRDDRSGLIVRHRHHAAAAAAEQTMVCGVDRHRHRVRARRRRPPPRHRQRLRVDLDDLRGVSEVRVDLAVDRRRAVLGLPAERDVGHELPCGIDHRRRVRIAVEGEYAIGRRVVDDRVGILRRRDAAERLVGLQIEHDDVAAVSRRRETVSGLRRDRGAVRAVDVLHLAEQLSVAGVDDHHAILPSDEHAMVRRIRDDVVPAALAAENPGVRNAIRGRRLCERQDDQHDSHRRSFH